MSVDKNVFFLSLDLDGDENESSLDYAFVFKIPADFSGDLDETIEEFTEEMEKRFGIHDWSSGPCPEANGIGYTSYEIENPNECMDAWQAFFVQLLGADNVSPWVTVGNTSLNSDLKTYKETVIALKTQKNISWDPN